MSASRRCGWNCTVKLLGGLPDDVSGNSNGFPRGLEALDLLVELHPPHLQLGRLADLLLELTQSCLPFGNAVPRVLGLVPKLGQLTPQRLHIAAACSH